MVFSKSRCSRCNLAPRYERAGVRGQLAVATGMANSGPAYQPPDPTRAGIRQTWVEYARSFTVEWAAACCISMLMGAVLLGCGALLAWPLRSLSDAVLTAVDTIGAPARGGANDTVTQAARAETPLVLQSVWDFAAKDYGNITTSPAFPGMLSIAYFFSSCLPYMLIDMLPASVPVIGSLKQYKVQKDKPVEWEHIWKTLRTTMYMTVGLQIPGLAHQLVTQGPWPYYVGPHVCMTQCSHMTLPEKAPSVLEVVLHLFLCLWLMDILYFFYHKHHHQRTWRYGLLLYKHIHGVHHEWRAPFAWCTQYLHPIELSFTGLASILSPIIVNAHPCVGRISITHPP
eukprot:COSAG02_NODE_1036_length_15051_cov_25.548154_15_plen_342_part_00